MSRFEIKKTTRFYIMGVGSEPYIIKVNILFLNIFTTNSDLPMLII